MLRQIFSAVFSYFYHIKVCFDFDNKWLEVFFEFLREIRRPDAKVYKIIRLTLTWIHLCFTSNCGLIRKLGHQYGRRGGINSGEVSHFLSLGCVKKENITQRRRRTKYIWIFEWFASLCLVNYIVSYLVLGLINVLYIDIICFLTLKKSHLKLKKKKTWKKSASKCLEWLLSVILCGKPTRILKVLQRPASCIESHSVKIRWQNWKR